ncbi:MAG: hypothetical protein KY462_16060 [Actinobacteria bacterium]|nr:hypothetical protein [Actinomycetota bacterium]
MRHLAHNGRLVAVSAVAALVLAACGSGTDDPGTQQTSDQQTETHDDMGQDAAGEDPFGALKRAANHVGNDGSAQAVAGGVAAAAGLEGDIESPAAQAYASLATLLQEHVYLAGIAVDMGLSAGLDSREFEAAAAALDENSVELADVVGSVGGEEKRDAFLGLWREHIGFFVNYAEGAAGGDDDMKQQALDNLDGYRQQAGAFFQEVTGGELPADAVAESLSGHIDTLTQAIDAAAAGDTSVFAELKEAATHVGEDGSAKALASGVAAAAGLEGDIEAPAVQAYVTLSTLLEEHVYLAGIAVKTAYSAGLDSPAFEAAADTLDENSVELADVVGSVAGEDKRDAFLDLWREHIGFFVNYAEGAAGNDDDMKQQALDNLDGYRQQAGAFFEEVTGGELPADAVAESLSGHIDTLTRAIDALAAALTG